MTKKELKDTFYEIIQANQAIGTSEIRRIFNEALLKWDREHGWDKSNKQAAWTDEQLRVILSDAPTKDNCLKYAQAFKRGYGSIEQIYRWAASSDEEIKSKRPDDTFVAQIKRVAKELGWRAG